jgi:NADPH2:quinone reductase
MRAAIIAELGALPSVGERVLSEPGPDEMAIRVTTAALNPADLVYASGVRFRPQTPFVPGIEAVGTSPDGQRVYFQAARPVEGTLAEQTLGRAGQVRQLPDDITDEQALCLGVAGTAAWLALTYKGALRAGESVLVLGATGSVGQVGVQAAKALGARRVVAAGRDRPTLEGLLGSGADAVVALDGDVQSRLVEASEGGFDLVIDTLFGAPMIAGIHATRPGGRIVNVGMRAGRTVELSGISLKGRDLLSCSVETVPQPIQAQAFADLCDVARAGGIEVAYERTALADIARTWERQASSPHVKLLVVP